MYCWSFSIIMWNLSDSVQICTIFILYQTNNSDIFLLFQYDVEMTTVIIDILHYIYLHYMII